MVERWTLCHGCLEERYLHTKSVGRDRRLAESQRMKWRFPNEGIECILCSKEGNDSLICLAEDVILIGADCYY